jgi:hypothetical protein
MSEPLRVMIGYDPRQPLAFTVAAHSVARHSSKPVAVTPLILKQLPITRRGLTEFTYSRFLVPWLCGFKGKAVFMDADVVVRGDIAELFEEGGMSAVSVVQQQPRFEWPSVMLFNNGACQRLTPEFVNDPKNQLFDFEWAPYVGDLPKKWAHLVDYEVPEPANLYHFTCGIPVWPQTQGNPEDELWFDELEAANHTVPWEELMASSVHASRAKC